MKISEQLGTREYVNPFGGIDLFDRDKFSKSGIKLNFIYPKLQEYNQRRNSFDVGLSIIDIMMNVSVDGIREHLKMFELKN